MDATAPIAHNHAAKRLRGARRWMLLGGVAGALLGAATTLILFIWPGILAARAGGVFSGATQGTDQYTYFAMVRALMRSPTGITYSYPFALWWPTPPVLFQPTFVALAWLARVVGIPVAFEIGRVAGAAASGAALGAMAWRLAPGKGWTRWVAITMAFGGGSFWVVATAVGMRDAGHWMILPWYFEQEVMGTLFMWMPFLAQNVYYPLEAIYHALVLGALAALMFRRNKTALVLGAVAWFSNPFTAVALAACVLPWWAGNAWVARPGSRERRRAAQQLAAWVAVSVVAMAYYGWFLPRWPALDDLTRWYAALLNDRLSLAHFVMLWTPLGAGAVWSLVSKRGRRLVWGNRNYRLMALLVWTQLALAQQALVLGESAVQPMHYNRGYMAVGLAALTWRAFRAWAPKPRRVPRWAVVIALLALPDQAFFVAYLTAEGSFRGIEARETAEITATLRTMPGPLVVHGEWYSNSYLAAMTDHVPFYNIETNVMPFPELRVKALGDVREGRRTLEEVGIDALIVGKGSSWVEPAKAAGWRRAREGVAFDVYVRRGL
ncbi:hypothetical protein CVU37_05005 [candidate division BRC1 bacterium HGW-BRC1-1]|jgi:hypothetical protein|nr:MAG: hypothetical protein CVU37_05005 [candidate division BRC1 bacterium HGW-BRC1-1]